MADDPSEPVTHHLGRSPALGPLYVRAALPAIPGVSLLPGLRPRRQPEMLSAVRLELHDLVADAEHLDAYDRVCGYARRDVVPVTFPHVLAFPLHLTLMTMPTFPFAAIGTLHISNRIELRRPIATQQPITLAVWADRLTSHRRGRTVTLISEAVAEGDVVWREETVLLARGDGDSAAPDRHTAMPSEAPPGPARWSLDSGLGRRYAAVSGDRNPIHLYDLTAKAFGFRRHIAHGMWTKARCLAEIDNKLPDAYAVEVGFRKPIELPGQVTFGARQAGGQLDFGVRGRSGNTHILGRIVPLDG